MLTGAWLGFGTVPLLGSTLGSHGCMRQQAVGLVTCASGSNASGCTKPLKTRTDIILSAIQGNS